jgi:transcriptional regulator with XRE-family HTH domain
MATIYEKFGSNIKKYRKAIGLTQEKLAESAKIDPKSIISIENGVRNPTLRTIYRLAKALKVGLKELVEF